RRVRSAVHRRSERVHREAVPAGDHADDVQVAAQGSARRARPVPESREEVTTLEVSHELHAGPAPPPHGWRRLIAPGWLRVPWVTALFFGIVVGLVVLIRWAEGWKLYWDGQVIATVSLATVGFVFLVGLGGFDYWGGYAIGSPTRPEDHSGHGAYSWRDYFRVNTDHKVIGIQYVVTTIFFFVAAGLTAMVMRAELARPGMQYVGNQVF